jgi:hypothetical protein
MASEVRLQVPGYPGYEVADDGSVWTSKLGAKAHGGWRQLAASAGVNGYPRVTLSHLNVQKDWHVHELVMLAFVGPRPARSVIRHLNGDPSDNRLVNLSYGSYAENEADKDRHGRRVKGSAVHGAKLTESSVVVLRNRFAQGASYPELIGAFGLNHSAIHRALHGRTFSHVPVPDYSGRTKTHRPRSGSGHPNAKLDESKALYAKEQIASGRSQTDVAKELGVSRSAISHIVNGSTWAAVARNTAT